MIIDTNKPTTVSDAAKLHPFITAHKPHGFASYQLLQGKDRRDERRYAKLAGEWKHPACGELDKMTDVIITQHQTNRSWQHCYCNLDERPNHD